MLKVICPFDPLQLDEGGEEGEIVDDKGDEGDADASDAKIRSRQEEEVGQQANFMQQEKCLVVCVDLVP